MISSLEIVVFQVIPFNTFLSHISLQILQLPHLGESGSCNSVSSGALVKTVPRHCAAPYLGVINKLFFPIHPNPLSTATVLFGRRDCLCATSNFPSAIRLASDCEKALYPFGQVILQFDQTNLLLFVQ